VNERLWRYGLLAALLLVFHVALVTGAWSLWGIPRPVDRPFLDLYALLAAADCHLEGRDVFVDNPCDWLGRPHVYPRTWLAFSALGLGRGDVVAVGYLMDLAFFLALAFVARPRGWSDVGVTLLVGISPGIMLAVERANFDLVAFAMLSMLVWLRGSTPGVWTGGSLILLAGALKIYPLVALGPWAWENRRRARAVVAMLVVVLAITVIGAWAWRDDWAKMATRVPAPTSRFFSMGAPLLFEHLGLPHATFLGRAALAIGAVAAAAYGRAHVVVRERRFDVLLGATLLLFCFFARTNYDYRWVFLALVLPAAWHAGPVGRAVIGASAVVLWTEAVTIWLGNLLGGGPLMAVVIAVAPIVDHAASWVAVLGCTALAAGTATAER
jgi:hypothetical protein